MGQKCLPPIISSLYANRGGTRRFASRTCGQESTYPSTARQDETKAIGFAILQRGSSGRDLHSSSTYASPVHGPIRGHVTQTRKGTLTSKHFSRLLRVVMVKQQRDGAASTTIDASGRAGVLENNYSSSPRLLCEHSMPGPLTRPPSFHTLHS